MPNLVNGYLTEQKVVTVAGADETAINTEITTQASDSWLLQNIFFNGSDAILLFQRTTQEVH